MIGIGELIVILCIVLLLFGGKKLPEFAKNLGQGVREFKKALQGDEKEDGSTCCQHEKVPTEKKECSHSCPHIDEQSK